MISVILFHVKNYVKTDEIELKCLGQGHISLHYTGCNMEILSPFSSDLYADLMVEWEFWNWTLVAKEYFRLDLRWYILNWNWKIYAAKFSLDDYYTAGL